MEYQDILKFHTKIWDEVERGKTDIAVKKYYRNVLNNKNKRWFYAHNWARRVENLAGAITPGALVLDTASGLGSEALFAANFGAEVIGVDIKLPFVEVAKKRKEYYEKELNKTLNLSFFHKGVIGMKSDRLFDVVWCMEAISHIYTTEQFIETTFNLLRPGGKLIISDPNAINPAVQVQYIMSSGIQRGVFERTDPETGEKTFEYDENILPPLRLAKMIKKAGFKIEKINYSIYTPPSLIKSEQASLKIRDFENICNKIPLVKHLGGIYTIIGVKI